MKSFWRVTALVAAVAISACDSSLGVDLSGLWFAESYVYESASGEMVDLVERDGASMSLTVDLFGDGRRRVTALFNDGSGGTENLTGEVSLDDGLFIFETKVFQFTRRDALLTLTNTSDSFDFGDGLEPATLTIRLMQL